MYRYIAFFHALCYPFLMQGARFEWDDDKDEENRAKQDLPFESAQYAFADPRRAIAEDLGHGGRERRHFCFGKGPRGIMTVRFTHRAGVIRIFGDVYWRKRRKTYEEENKIRP